MGNTGRGPRSGGPTRGIPFRSILPKSRTQVAVVQRPSRRLPEVRSRVLPGKITQPHRAALAPPDALRPLHMPVRISFRVVVSTGDLPPGYRKRFAGNSSPVMTRMGKDLPSRIGPGGMSGTSPLSVSPSSPKTPPRQPPKCPPPGRVLASGPRGRGPTGHRSRTPPISSQRPPVSQPPGTPLPSRPPPSRGAAPLLQPLPLGPDA